MSVTPEIRAEIVSQFERNPQRFSPFRTATALGIPVKYVLGIVAELREPAGRSQERNGGYGREELRQHLVARRPAMDGGWDNTDPAIANARAAYAAGTHTMTTGRDGRWLLLYSIPLQRPLTPQPTYFNTEKHA